MTDEEVALSPRRQRTGRRFEPVDEDDVAARLVADDEFVFGQWEQATLALVSESGEVTRDDGRLYVTSRRLVHVGRANTTVPLGDIIELAMASGRVLVTLSGARGLIMEVDDAEKLKRALARARVRARRYRPSR